MRLLSSSTFTVSPQKYDDPVTNDLIEWVRNVPYESDAVHNIPVILRQYDRQKPLWQRIKCLFF